MSDDVNIVNIRNITNLTLKGGEYRLCTLAFAPKSSINKIRIDKMRCYTYFCISTLPYLDRTFNGKTCCPHCFYRSCAMYRHTSIFHLIVSETSTNFCSKERYMAILPLPILKRQKPIAMIGFYFRIY